MIIYKLTNKTNGKVYIGKSRRSLQYRKQQYQKEIDDPTINRPIVQALREFGIDGF